MWNFILYTVVVIFLFKSGGAHKEMLSSDCLNCLCKELTHCNLKRSCSNGNCGMFAITEPFWWDAGSPKVRSHTRQSTAYADYEACACNLDCASTTIQQYMRRFQRDCNHDGVIDCGDYAAIHMHGPAGCYQHANSAFVQSVKQCLEDNTDYNISPIDWRSNMA